MARCEVAKDILSLLDRGRKIITRKNVILSNLENHGSFRRIIFVNPMEINPKK